MAKLQGVKSSATMGLGGQLRGPSSRSQTRSENDTRQYRMEDPLDPGVRPLSPNSNKWLDQFEYLCPNFMESLFPPNPGQGYNAPTGTTGRAGGTNVSLSSSTDILEQIYETFQCVHPQACCVIQPMIYNLYFLACLDFKGVTKDKFMNDITRYREVVGASGYANYVRMDTRIKNLCEFVCNMRKLTEFVLKSPPAEVPNPRFRTAGSNYGGGSQGILKNSNPNMNPYGQQSQGNFNNMGSMGNMGQNDPGMYNQMGPSQQGYNGMNQMGQNQQGMYNGMNQMGQNQPGMNNGMNQIGQNQQGAYGNNVGQVGQSQQGGYGNSMGQLGQSQQGGYANEMGQQGYPNSMNQMGQNPNQQGMNQMGQSQQSMNMMGQNQQGMNQMGQNRQSMNQMGQNQQGMNNMGMPQDYNNTGYNRPSSPVNNIPQMQINGMNQSQTKMNTLAQNSQGSIINPNMYPPPPGSQQGKYPMDNGMRGGNAYNNLNQQMNPSDGFYNGGNVDMQQQYNDPNTGLPLRGNCKIDFGGVSSDNSQLEKMLNSAITNAFQKGYQCKKKEQRCPKPRRPRCPPVDCGPAPTLVEVPLCNTAPSCPPIRRCGGGNPGKRNDTEADDLCVQEMFICGKSFKHPPSITNFEKIRPLKIPGFDLYTQPNKCGKPTDMGSGCQPQRMRCHKPPPAAWKRPVDSCKAPPKCIPLQQCLPPPPPCMPCPMPQVIRKPRVPICPVSRCPEPPGNILCILPPPTCDVRVRDMGCSNTNLCNHINPKCRPKHCKKKPTTPVSSVVENGPQEEARRMSVLPRMLDVRNTHVQTDPIQRNDFGAQVEIETPVPFGGGKAPSLPEVRGSGVFSNPEIAHPKQNCSAVFRIRLEGPDFQCVAPTVEIENTPSRSASNISMRAPSTR